MVLISSFDTCLNISLKGRDLLAMPGEVLEGELLQRICSALFLPSKAVKHQR